MGKTYLFNYEDGTPKSLYDSLSFITGLLQDSYESPINFYKSPIKRLQDSYKFPINFLPRDYRTPINLLSRDHKSPIKRF